MYSRRSCIKSFVYFARPDSQSGRAAMSISVEPLAESCIKHDHKPKSRLGNRCAESHRSRTQIFPGAVATDQPVRDHLRKQDHRLPTVGRSRVRARICCSRQLRDRRRTVTLILQPRSSCECVRLTWGRNVAAVDLAVALSAVGEEGLLQCLALADVGQERLVVERGASAMARVTSHAQERGRLAEQIVLPPSHGARDRSCNPESPAGVRRRTAPLLLVASIADQIHRRFLQEPERLPVRVVTVAADHLAFEDRVV